jgi:hypothetical protein
LFGTTLLSACAPGTDPKDVIDDTLDNIGCEDAQSKFWDSLYRVAENGSRLPNVNALEEALLSEAQARGLSSKKFDHFAEEFIRQYRVIERTASAQSSSSADPQELVRALVALETGDASSDELSFTRDALKELKIRVASAQADLEEKCPEKPEAPSVPTPGPIVPPQPPMPNPPPSGSLFEQIKTQLAPEVYGARKTVTTAYQSCEVLRLRAMNESDASVEGIKITGEHPSGGLTREIASLASVRRTHYYLNQVPQQEGSTCHGIMNAPLIYDFGGKPFASTTNSRLLDFFTNHGSGTKVLGMDCSGYVFSALAAGGLKLDPETEMKAVHVTNIPARRYMKPEDGMRCFDHVKMAPGSGLKAGDIAASTGHIIMVDEVGADPFALAGIRNASECTPANIDSNKFNFVISQSSPSKGGIGINRMQARDYFKEANTYRNGFVQFAVAACKAKFGESIAPKVSSLSLVRHKKTAACTTTPFTLQKESCLYLCPAL